MPTTNTLKPLECLATMCGAFEAIASLADRTHIIEGMSASSQWMISTRGKAPFWYHQWQITYLLPLRVSQTRYPLSSNTLSILEVRILPPSTNRPRVSEKTTPVMHGD